LAFHESYQEGSLGNLIEVNMTGQNPVKVGKYYKRREI